MEKLEQAGVDLSRPFIVLHPGAAEASRRYPPQQFAAATKLVSAQTGHQIVVIGGAEQHQLVETVRLHAARGTVAWRVN